MMNPRTNPHHNPIMEVKVYLQKNPGWNSVSVISKDLGLSILDVIYAAGELSNMVICRANRETKNRVIEYVMWVGESGL